MQRVEGGQQPGLPTLTFLITINAQYTWERTLANIEVSQSQRRPLLLVESTMVGRHEIGADAKVIRNERFGARKILKAVCL